MIKINAPRTMSDKQKEALRYARSQKAKNNDFNTAHTTGADTNPL